MSIRLNSDTEVMAKTFGARGARLALMVKLGLPVPDGVILSSATVHAIANGEAVPELPKELTSGGLLSVRSSPENRPHLPWFGPTLGRRPRELESVSTVRPKGHWGRHRGSPKHRPGQRDPR